MRLRRLCLTEGEGEKLDERGTVQGLRETIQDENERRDVDAVCATLWMRERVKGGEYERN